MEILHQIVTRGFRHPKFVIEPFLLLPAKLSTESPIHGPFSIAM